MVIVDFELKPGFTGHFHFGSEDEAGGGAGGFVVREDDTPEVEGIAREVTWATGKGEVASAHKGLSLNLLILNSCAIVDRGEESLEQ